MKARRMSTARLDLVTATAQHLLVALDDASKLARLLAAELPDGWPPPGLDPTELRRVLDELHRGPEQIGWWLRYAVLRSGPDGRPTLAGAVGLRGLPRDGEVHVECSLLPALATGGLAAEAIAAVTDWAFEQPEVERIVARGDAHGLDAIGFERDGDLDDGAPRHVKIRQTWLDEGPPSRRAPRLVPRPADDAIAGLPPVAREVFERLLAEPLLEADALRREIRSYVTLLEEAAATNPYVDDELGRDIARICEGLLDAVIDDTPEITRRQIQAAARYFVTEEDGDSDLAIGGLDEDAAVANAVAEHLGRSDLVSALL